MKFPSTKLYTQGVIVLAVALVAILFSYAGAAPINYGDFTGTSVMYLDVTETANTPDDTEPLFGPPSIIGNTLFFEPGGFSASATDGSSDLTDSQLNFTLMGIPGAAITSFTINERGEYNLLGTGTAATQIVYGVGIGNISVSEIDGIPLALPIPLASASASGGDNLSLGTDVLTAWDLSLTYDVNAALNAAGVNFVSGATKLKIAINDSLAAISEDLSISFIAKKGFQIGISSIAVDPDNTIPEPTAVALIGLALVGLGLVHRRRE